MDGWSFSFVFGFARWDLDFDVELGRFWFLGDSEFETNFLWLFREGLDRERKFVALVSRVVAWSVMLDVYWVSEPVETGLTAGMSSGFWC